MYLDVLTYEQKSMDLTKVTQGEMTPQTSKTTALMKSFLCQVKGNSWKCAHNVFELQKR